MTIKELIGDNIAYYLPKKFGKYFIVKNKGGYTRFTKASNVKKFIQNNRELVLSVFYDNTRIDIKDTIIEIYVPKKLTVVCRLLREVIKSEPNNKVRQLLAGKYLFTFVYPVRRVTRVDEFGYNENIISKRDIYSRDGEYIASLRRDYQHVAFDSITKSTKIDISPDTLAEEILLSDSREIDIVRSTIKSTLEGKPSTKGNLYVDYCEQTYPIDFPANRTKYVVTVECHDIFDSTTYDISTSKYGIIDIIRRLINLSEVKALTIANNNFVLRYDEDYTVYKYNKLKAYYDNNDAEFKGTVGVAARERDGLTVIMIDDRFVVVDDGKVYKIDIRTGETECNGEVFMTGLDLVGFLDDFVSLRSYSIKYIRDVLDNGRIGF